MQLFDVYPKFDINLEKAQGVYVWDTKGVKYLDLYGGHAVISIGHSHPYYIQKITDQLNKIGFYSNTIQMPVQDELAEKLGALSGYPDYNLFMCNSGAEAIENALKLASFQTGRSRVIAFKNSFHGRTSAAVSITDNPAIVAPINKTSNAVILPLNDEPALRDTLKNNDVCAIIIEGIQGIGGIYVPQNSFLQTLRSLADEYGAMLIIDEIQSGYGRTGKFFAFQFAAVQPDIITVAKGMGNGFPVAGVLIHPKIKATTGMLGSTFGGNQLACVAGIAVLDVMKQENLMANAQQVGEYLIAQLKQITDKRITSVRGRGLMIGVQFNFAIADLRKELLFKHQIFTGFSKKNILRLLPPLNLTQQDADVFLDALRKVLEKM